MILFGIILVTKETIDVIRLIEEGYKAPDESDEGTSEPPVTAVIEKTSFRDLIENSVTYRDKVC